MIQSDALYVTYQRDWTRAAGRVVRERETLARVRPRDVHRPEQHRGVLGGGERNLRVVSGIPRGSRGRIRRATVRLAGRGGTVSFLYSHDRPTDRPTDRPKLRASSTPLCFLLKSLATNP